MDNLLCFDTISLILTSLICFITFVSAYFSMFYMRFDNRALFISKLILLSLGINLIVLANHFSLIVFGFLIIHIILPKLVNHVANFESSKLTAEIIKKNTLSSALILTLTFIVVSYVSNGQIYSITSLNSVVDLSHHTKVFLGMSIFLVSMINSGLYPFHKGIVSSINSPTPLSSFLHAGIANLSGIMLFKFFNLFTESNILMYMVFFVGAANTILGAVYMQVQTNFKKGLVFSTISQMGFMLIQFGLGLFTFAFSHLILHACFKCFHFLDFGNGTNASKKSPFKFEITSHLNKVFIVLPAVLSVYMVITLTDYNFDIYSSEVYMMVLMSFFYLNLSRYSMTFLKDSNYTLKLLVTTFLSFLFAVMYITIFTIMENLGIDNLSREVGLLELMILGLVIFFTFYLKNNLTPRLYMRIVNNSV